MMRIPAFISTLFLAGCLLLGSVAQLRAVPAEPVPVRKTQPDGTEIVIIQRGDEKVHWMETLNGYTLLYDADRYVVYAAVDADSNLVASSLRYMGDSPAGTPAPSIDGRTPLQKGLRYSPAQVAVLLQLWEVAGAPRAQQRATPSPVPTPVLGEKRALCVLMQYPDMPMVKTKQDFENLLNQAGYSVDGAIGSVRDFYLENSYGQMTLNIAVAGPYMAAHNHKYYGNGQGNRGWDLAEEAIRAAAADIDLSEYANADNRLETFHVIFAGHGAESSANNDDIWSHKWMLNAPIILDGATVYDYSCSPELRKATGNNITHIGVICHELCHVFGAPDYYDTDGGAGGNFEGTGNWDLMANGMWNGPDEAHWGAVPAHINMFQKIQYGWVTPVELTGGQDVTGMPNSASSAVAYVIKVGDEGEQYVLENRQRVGFDGAIPGHGLLIYHVHPLILRNTDNSSNARHPQQLYPVCAAAAIAKPNADPKSYGGINSEGCPFPGQSGNRYFTDATVPMSFSWETGEGIQSPVTDITETGGEISFGYKRKSAPSFEFALSRGDATISKQTAHLTFTITGDTPLSYKASEDAARLDHVVWKAFSPSATYTFESNGAGYKTVYTKLKNEIGETAVKSAVIYFAPIEKPDASAAAMERAQAQDESLKIYPTAVETLLTVERKPDAPPANITVLSTTGMPCLSKRLTAPTETLNLSKCPSGLLLIHLFDGKKREVRSIFKL